MPSGRKPESKLQTGDNSTLGRSKKRVVGFRFGPNLQRHVAQRPNAKRPGVEYLIEAEGAADKAAIFRRAGAICRTTGAGY
jgi:hypothetical protein